MLRFIQQGPSQESLDLNAVGDQLHSVVTLRPSLQVGDDRQCGAQQDDPGPERQPAYAVGWEDRHSPDGPLVGAGPVIAQVTESVYSSRSPIRELRSCRSRLSEAPPSITLTIEASQIASA